MIFSRFKFSIVKKNFELRFLKRGVRFPYPFVDLDVFQWYSFIPVKSHPFASDEERVGKTAVEFYNNCGVFLLES